MGKGKNVKTNDKKNYIASISHAQKVKHVINWSIRLLLLVALVGAVINQRWFIVLITVVTFVLTFLPYVFERRYNVDLPEAFEIVIVLFIFGTLFLGEVHGYYTRFIWWDAVLHGVSAFALGLIGFTVMYVLYRGGTIRARASLLALFGFSFAVMMGAVWEIFEFAMDSFFGFNMQKSGLVDTMWDLIVDVIGAFLASAAGYFYIKTGKTMIFGSSIKMFEESNPWLFGKKKRKKNHRI